jgi:GntR family transcriptional regulator/MocR family aminotransferase
MAFTLQPGNAAPLYRQIGAGLRSEIVAGTLTAGTRLPSARQLARDLGVSRITVDNAYAELIAEGVLEARAGVGTFVLPPWTPADTGAAASEAPLPPWQMRLATDVPSVRDRMLRQVLRGPIVDDTISFAWGAGDPRLAPTGEFRRRPVDVQDIDGAAALGPEHSDGYPPLRATLADYLRQLGLTVGPEEILVTSGTQQAIGLVCDALLRPGATVVVEEPTWPGVLDALESRHLRAVGVPLDADGLRADALSVVLEQSHPGLIYTVPTFHNPTGIVMSAARRREVVALAHRHGVPILEDDHVREVRFGNPIPPPLAALDPHGTVIHTGSFTKSLLPALRLGYVVARGPLHDRLLTLKRAADLFSSTLLQRALCRYLEGGAIRRHWKHVSRIYRRRHAAMLHALERHFPPGTTWTGVEGGLVLWVGVQPGVSVAALFEEALRAGVTFVAGAAFYPVPADQPFLRLNFAAVDEDQIERGIATLGQLLHQYHDTSPP